MRVSDGAFAFIKISAGRTDVALCVIVSAIRKVPSRTLKVPDKLINDMAVGTAINVIVPAIRKLPSCTLKVPYKLIIDSAAGLAR